MTKRFKTEFNYEQVVVLKTDPGTIRIVNGFLLRPGSVLVGLACGEEETWHQMHEIAPARPEFKIKGFVG
jgi:hypothetical protein